MDLCNRLVIQNLMESSGIGFRKELGQNFLISPEIPKRCAQQCEQDPQTLILEIGPGIGALTAELSNRFRHVVCVEIDERLIPVLGEVFADRENVTVICGDIMKTDVARLLAEVKEKQKLAPDFPVAVCANLPYYITTPILMYLLESGIRFSSVTVMVQSEVADRFTAEPGSAKYGSITTALHYYGEVRRLFNVPAGCFLPAPKVNSAVIRIALFEKPPYAVKNEKLLFTVIRAAFEQRRKTLINALTTVFCTLSKAELAEAICESGLPEKIRGEKLSVPDFVRLTDAITARLSDVLATKA